MVVVRFAWRGGRPGHARPDLSTTTSIRGTCVACPVLPVCASQPAPPRAPLLVIAGYCAVSTDGRRRGGCWPRDKSEPGVGLVGKGTMAGWLVGLNQQCFCVGTRRHGKRAGMPSSHSKLSVCLSEEPSVYHLATEPAHNGGGRAGGWRMGRWFQRSHALSLPLPFPPRGPAPVSHDRHRSGRAGFSLPLPGPPWAKSPPSAGANGPHPSLTPLHSPPPPFSPTPVNLLTTHSLDGPGPSLASSGTFSRRPGLLWLDLGIARPGEVRAGRRRRVP